MSCSNSWSTAYNLTSPSYGPNDLHKRQHVSLKRDSTAKNARQEVQVAGNHVFLLASLSVVIETMEYDRRVARTVTTRRETELRLDRLCPWR